MNIGVFGFFSFQFVIIDKLEMVQEAVICNAIGFGDESSVYSGGKEFQKAGINFVAEAISGVQHGGKARGAGAQKGIEDSVALQGIHVDQSVGQFEGKGAAAFSACAAI